jgi:hypothetical protein
VGWDSLLFDIEPIMVGEDPFCMIFTCPGRLLSSSVRFGTCSGELGSLSM